MLVYAALICTPQTRASAGFFQLGILDEHCNFRNFQTQSAHESIARLIQPVLHLSFYQISGLFGTPTGSETPIRDAPSDRVFRASQLAEAC